MNKKKIDIFLICPVRHVHGRTEAAIQKYVQELEKNGKVVYWPQRDTNQIDPTGGIRICRDNINAIIEAKEIHVWWNRPSVGSKFDLGGAMTSIILLSQLTGEKKKIVIANPDNVEATKNKSFENVLLALAEAEDIIAMLQDLK